MEMPSKLAMVGYSRSTCGYCSPKGLRSKSPKSNHTFGVWAHHLTPATYKLLVDSGWRRSGSYLYKPDNLRTCCPHYTVRLDPQLYRPSKSQRRALTNLYWLLRPSVTFIPQKAKGKWNERWDVERIWSSIEGNTAEDSELACSSERPEAVPISHPRSATINAPYLSRALRTTLEPAVLTEEKFKLYRRYQVIVHKDKVKDVTRAGFERFLCGQKSLAVSWTQSRGEGIELPYGPYHHEYRLDGKLIAVGVIDILPGALSSVYLFHDPAYMDWQLGKLSTLNEIRLARRLAREVASSDDATAGSYHYYLGYLVPSCPKMRYKAEWGPSEVLDMATNEWSDLAKTLPELDRLTSTRSNEDDQAPSSTPAVTDQDTSASDNDDETDDSEDEENHRLIPDPAPPGFLPRIEAAQDEDLLGTATVSIGNHPINATVALMYVPKTTSEHLLDLLGALGRDISKDVVVQL